MDSEFRILNSHKFTVGSARNLKFGKKLDEKAKDRICLALNQIIKNYDFSKLSYVAVATEAFRMASDGKLFLDYVETKFNIKFTIITPFDEAKFIELAVIKKLQTLKIPTQNLLIIDLGGASTEISFNKEYKSFKFGILKFYNEFENFMEENAKFVVQEARNFISNLKPNKIILTSTIPVNLAMLKFGVKDLNLINGKSLKYSDFAYFKAQISNSCIKELDFKKEKISLIMAGIILFENLLSDFDEFVVINDGLMEGIMIDKILKEKK